MTIDQILMLRLRSQHLTIPYSGSAAGLLNYMGAMQAQDYPMVQLAIGLRIHGFARESVSEAFGRGEILRTHLLRPTWHVVSASNISWMIDLTAPRMKTSMNTRHMELGLTSQLLAECLTILEKELTGNRHLSRDEIVKRLQQDGIDTSGNRSSHIMMLAELEKLVCSGSDNDGRPTYALFEERVPSQASVSREEALARLALIYFTSHGPATLQDFSWWSGQNLRDATIGLEQAKIHLASTTIGTQIFWMKPGSEETPAREKEMILLPAYDEYIISYKERERMIPAGKMAEAVSSNGMFWPVILLNGKAIGSWSRTIQKNRIAVKASFFENPGRQVKTLFHKQALALEGFFGMKIEVEK